MKKFRKYADKPFIGPIVKKVINFAVSRQADQISQHFSEYLSPVVAFRQELQEESFKIRHNVYCDELKFEDKRINCMEQDAFDKQSTHCLIQHLPTGNYAGTVRIVKSNNDQELLPIEKYCSSSIDNEKVHPKNFPRHEICEISRLAVPAQFRKRQTDRYAGSATGVINEQIYSERELRCFPFIAVGLYLSAASICLRQDINHCFVMMEPRLARSLRFVGIPFEKVGPVVEYHGQRAPYYISRNLLMTGLTPGFKKMLYNIDKKITCQFKINQ
ncbi:PEP-CTERM/exosortase system-associated acyltransferase [Paraglaciecola sp. MB-3u-78]|uniref:PEP-CTERM/exosortase system-associated acyltransferase n=1 Tax=Paraglaciecola sp. MB-3u-78 TaxID=2058332 RepID=UPI000C349166|nr:PEP-CTERM/exosortase system-associated acyltransferase [Paraglaciecola sp. MB-3u-78]PKG92983.1 PEP-CTERM/exosortase system-associated acyltransferase [Paraglaciecola sp. MB-3u-78]